MILIRPFLLMVVVAAVSAVELTLLTPEPCADDLVTWEVTDPLPGWKQTDVGRTPVLTVTSPSGNAWVRRAYLDQAFARNPQKGGAEYLPSGERRLCIRHTPRLPGAHRWVLRDATGAELAQGTLLVKPARGPSPVGMLQVSKDNPRLLAFRDGTIFIPIGPNIAWANGPDRLANLARYFARLAESGGNHARVWFSSWFGQIEGDEPDAYRLDQAWVMDQVLALARTHRLRLTLVLDNHHDLTEGKAFPYGATLGKRRDTFITAMPPAQYERRLRYVLARWGADDCIAAWELMNELDLAQPSREEAVAWAKGASEMLKRLDVDVRLRTVSWSKDDWDLVANLPSIDLAQIHSYVIEWNDPIGLLRMGTRDGVQMLVNNADRANAIGKPFLFAELGYQGSNEKNIGNDLDVQGLLMRQQLWAGFLLGGYGSGATWWWDTYLENRNLWPLYRGMAAILPRLDWRDRELAPLTPNADSSLRVIGWQSPTQALVWPQLRADTWYLHLMEQKPRPQLRRQLGARLTGMKAGARYEVRYLDMLSGEEKGRREAIAGPQGGLDLAVVPPDVDTVLWVKLAE